MLVPVFNFVSKIFKTNCILMPSKCQQIVMAGASFSSPKSHKALGDMILASSESNFAILLASIICASSESLNSLFADTQELRTWGMRALSAQVEMVSKMHLGWVFFFFLRTFIAHLPISNLRRSESPLLPSPRIQILISNNFELTLKQMDFRWKMKCECTIQVLVSKFFEISVLG